MRVLVTGGTGFIGSALCEHYLAEGHEVRTLAKLATDAEKRNAQRIEQAGVEVVVGDVTSREAVRSACQGVGLVHHVAAAMREADKGRSTYVEVNVEGTRHILEEGARSGVDHVVYCSSVGVYGDISGRTVDEASECRPTNFYGETKLLAEGLVKEFVAKEQMPVVIVRPAEVYGPGDFRLLKLFRMVQKGRFILFGKGQGKHHMIQIEDLVGAMVLAGTRPELSGKTFILAGDQPIPLVDLLREIADVLGTKPPKLRFPLLPMMAAATVCEFSCRPFGIQPPLYRRRMDFFRHDWSFDTSAMKNVLGYSPRYDVRSGLERTVEGYRQRELLEPVVETAASV